ncbi:amino acid adenylation domain-containing protein [Xylariomycetidae sp. FL2044]|nr:amino acid adenylation domain-containing protein [Xylariomycetidae sp. FL2044]
MGSPTTPAAAAEGLSILNPLPTKLPGPQFLHHLLPRTAKSGLPPALHYLSADSEEILVSYPQLHAASDALASRIARVLESSSLSPGDPFVIPILAPQSPELYIALIAILKAGGAFCPLNLDAPRERIKFILQDVGAPVVLATAELASRLPVDDGNHRVVLLDDALKSRVHSDARVAFREAASGDLAYVMYTSGSTGTPKGVGISHVAVTQSLLAHDRHIPSFQRFLQFAAPTFDVSVFEIFFPLFRGGTLVCCSRAEMLTDLPRVLRRMQVDACELTPSVATSLLKKRRNAPGLRLLLTIGEMLTEHVVQEFGGDEHRESMLWGMYGPTEATIHCTLQPSFSTTDGKNNIGIPLDTVSAFIVDIASDAGDEGRFRALPLGHVGELAVGGHQLASGYFNRATQTARAFIDSPWGRIYRTGDRARMRPDGTIECLGRIDGSQVKLNGQRIELGEVEHALLRTPGCEGAVVAVVSNTLVAFAAVEGSHDMRREIIAQCKSWLPAFMVPADIQIMEKFPLLPSGKVDKKHLIGSYEVSQRRAEVGAQEFESDLERRLCELAGEILNQTIAPTSRLVSSGLDSLAAIEYASVIRDIGIVISPVEILSASTPRELLHRSQSERVIRLTHQQPSGADIDASQRLEHSSLAGVPHMPAESIERVERCTVLQQSMLTETTKDPRLYVNKVELSFAPGISAASVKAWFLVIAERNAILRTGFAQVDGRWCQVVWKGLRHDQVEIVSGKRSPPHGEDNRQTGDFLRTPLHAEIRREHSHTVAMLTLHHSIYDGWTVDLLIEDLSRLAGGSEPLRRPQFRELAHHHAVLLAGDRTDDKEFWAEYLRGSKIGLVPNFRTVSVPRPSIEATSLEIDLSPEVASDFARRSSVGPQTIFQAALGWLWAAVNGVDESVIGSVSSGRAVPVRGVEQIMGPCMSTLPLRINISRVHTILELLQSIHTADRTALRHGQLPLSDIIRSAGLTSAHNLFDVLFAYQETLPSRTRRSRIVWETWHKDAVEAKLLVEIQPRGNRYLCRATWHTDVFSEPQVAALVRQLDCLANHIVRSADESLSTISRCFPTEYLSHYNHRPNHVDVPPSLAALVETAASRYPSNHALNFATSIADDAVTYQTLTYAELNQTANQAARYLVDRGVAPGGTVAIVMEKSPLLYRTILGVLKTGCAYLPILPSTPERRIQLILEQSQPHACLVDASLQSRIAHLAPCPVVDMETAKLSGYPAGNVEIPKDTSRVAYVIYTSGTTGVPKGVCVTNMNILSNIEVLSRIYPHEPTDRMLQACSQAFDVSVFEIFFAWANGMCLCAATNDTFFENIERSVRAMDVTHLSMTVTVASLIKPSSVPNVRFLVTSGEPMTDSVLNEWADYLYQGYGPSETTNICTVRKVSRGDSSQFLGWSFENTSAFVLYPGAIDLTPLGCVGELCFGGAQVAAGYQHLFEVTATKFFDHPNYGRLYRSGDLGRMLPDGSLVILGRLDSQVKLRGLRIELQEIQAIVLKSGLARACTSMLVALGNDTVQRLALFYVPADHESTSCRLLPSSTSLKRAVRDLQQALQASLPDYMVPSAVFPISTMPLTSSGKVDSGYLEQSVASLSEDELCVYGTTADEHIDVADWDEAERMIADALCEELRVDKKMVGRWASFATLGLDSIRAMPLARGLQSRFRKRIPLSLVLRNPTVNRLAKAIGEVPMPVPPDRERAGLLPERLRVSTRDQFAGQGKPVADVLPCTPLQEAMLASVSSSDSKAAYCNQTVFRLRVPSRLVTPRWDAMFRRHSTLRTCFVTTDDVHFPTIQVILESYIPAWETIETDGSSLQRHLSDHMSTLPGAVDSGAPPISLALIRADEEEYISFVCHHALYDGISMGILLSEIEDSIHDRPLSSPPAFEAFLREALSSPPGVDEFWREHLRGFAPRELRETAAADDRDPVTVSTRALDEPLSVIESRLRDFGISLLSFCQTAWSVTLSLLQGGGGDVCFGNVVSGRSVAVDGIDTLVAPCFNTVPLRMNVSDAAFLLDIMKSFQLLNAAVLPFQFTGLRRIQSLVSSPVHLFESVFLLQPASRPLDGSIWAIELDHGAMDVPIVCEVAPSSETDTLDLQLHRDPSLFSHETSASIVDIFRNVMQACLYHPSSHVPSAAKLPTRCRDQILQLSPIAGRGVSHVAPDGSASDVWNPAEETVRRALSRLTRRPESEIGLHTPIYHYGLDSVTAVQLATLLRRDGCRVSAIDVIANPTCAGIAAHIKSAADEKPVPSYDFQAFRNSVSSEVERAVGRPAGFEEAILPCTPTQQGMISQFLASGGKHYFNYTSWGIPADVSVASLSRAWGTLTERHQVLRTGFVSVDHPDSTFAMVVYPVSDSAPRIELPSGSSFDVARWRGECAKRAVSDISSPPWRVAFVHQTMHLVMHHALYDAYSLRLLLRDLSDIVSGAPERYIPSIQQAMSLLAPPANETLAAETYWRSKSSSLAVSSFPSLTPLRVDQSVLSSAVKISDASTRDLRDRAAEADVTIQAAVQSAWARLLSAYLGEPAVVFGVVLDGRVSEELRSLAFPLVKTLPVVASDNDSNSALLASMMQYNQDLRRHEHGSLPQIQRWLGRPDGQLFDTIVVYQGADAEPEEEELPWEVETEVASVEYALSLEIGETRSGRLRFGLTFDTCVVPPEQGATLLRQFDAIFTHLLVDSQGHRTDLTLSAPDLFSILPAVRDELPAPASLLHELLERTARRSPAAKALEFVDELTGGGSSHRDWTYGDLDDMGNRVADLLVRLNIRPGSIVATCFNKCPEAYFATLGILKAGCAFLALDPSAPASRQEFILGDSGAACLLVEPGLESGLRPGNALPVHALSDAELIAHPASRPRPLRDVSPQDTCYCLYTSGTTGTPKGCLISHENTVQALLAFEVLFRGHWDARSRWLQFASFHFDVSVLEQYWSWYVGITVVAAPKDLILSDLAAAISKLKITHIDLTPSLARLVHPDEVPSLCRGVFITGGEQLRRDILRAWGPKQVIYNAYGPTEATIGVTMSRRVPANGKPSNIGTPFPNVGAYVFQPGTEIPVLRGAPGELCVSGKLVGQGYLGRPDLTRERFPILKRYGERVYRTGDLVRVLHDNSLDFLGRADDQVKLRGQRLEIGEINHAIRSGASDRVADVVTLVTRRAGQDRDLLVSFLAPLADAGRPGAAEVYSDPGMCRSALESCRDRLAGYMVPTYFLCISSIPLSANNKADANRLRSIFQGLTRDQLRAFTAGTAAARSQLDDEERSIRTALSRVVKIEASDVSPTSTIFDLGIDSITAVRLARQLRLVGFASATPSLVLRHPQISRLAEALRQTKAASFDADASQVRQSVRALAHRHARVACALLSCDRSDLEYISPCTPLQSGMIARSKSPGSRSAYFNSFSLRLDPSTSVKRLEEAWARIVHLYPILRTSFIETSDGYIQVAQRTVPLRWSDVSSSGDVTERYLAWVRDNEEIIRRPLEFEHLNVGDEHILTVRLFHGVYDAHSLQLILRNVEAAYHGGPVTTGPPFDDVLPRGPLRNHDKSRPFWAHLLEGGSSEHMPALVAEPGTSDAAVFRAIHVPGLGSRHRALGVTHQTMFQAAWLLALRRHFIDPPTIGIVLSGRSLPIDGIENVVGPLFNTLPFRIGYVESETYSSYLRRIHEINLAILEFVHTPLRDIQKWCSGGRPLFDALFTFDHDGESETAGSRLWSSVDASGPVDYPLSVGVLLGRGDSVQITATARAEIADPAALDQLLDEFARSLQGILTSEADTRIATPGADVISLGSDITSTTTEAPVWVSSPSSPPATDIGEFTWTDRAESLRRELSALAGMSDESISETSTIFELGLDSIDAIKLVARLRRLGFRVTVGDLLKRASIKSILETQQAGEGGVDASTADGQSVENSIPILRECLGRNGYDLRTVEAVLPPTPLQDSMMAEMLLSKGQRYLNHDVLEIMPDIDVDRLIKAWKTVYAKTPILRTTFAEVDDPRVDFAFCQIVRNDDVDLHTVTELPSLDDIAVVIEQARARTLGSRGAADLFQIALAKVRDKNYLVLSIAHALYDGWSLDLIHADVQAAYAGCFEARPSYRPYLAHLLRSTGPEPDNFWASYLHDVRPTVLDLPRDDAPARREPAVHRVEIPSELGLEDLKTLCGKYHITPQILGQGCWAAVLAFLSRTLEVTFGGILSGRDGEEAQDLVFPTMNTVPLRAVLHGTVTDFLGYLQESMSNVLEFQHLPLRQAQRLAHVHSEQLFNTIFLLQSPNRAREGRGALPTLVRSVYSRSAVEYPVSVELDLASEPVVWRIACDERYGSPGDARQILTYLSTVLSYFTKTPHGQVLEFDAASDRVSICGLDLVALKATPPPPRGIELGESDGAVGNASHADSSVIDVLSKLSGVEKHGINLDESIYHLGLDSISAIKASSLLRRRGLVVSVRDMLRAATIRDILKGIDDKAGEHGDSASPPGISDYKAPPQLADDLDTLLGAVDLRPDQVEAVLPALPVQVHTLSTWQNTDGQLFFPSFRYEINARVSQASFSRAWASLVAEIPVLRVVFAPTSSSPSIPLVQIVKKMGQGGFTVDPAVVEDEWNFEDTPSPYVSIYAWKVHPRKVNIHLYIHHALYDGVSLPMMIERLAQLCSPEPASRPGNVSAWCDFVSRHPAVDLEQERRTFWTAYLQGSGNSPSLCRTHAAGDRNLHRVSEFHPAAIHNVTKLRKAGSVHGVTLQALFFAAFSKVLASSHGGDESAEDVVFGVYLANRTSVSGLEHTPLPTLSIVPLRMKKPSFRDLLTLASEIQRDLLDISKFQNSSVALWEIHQWTGIKIDTFINFLRLPGDSGSTSTNSTATMRQLPENDQPAAELKGVDLSSHLARPDVKPLVGNRARLSYVDAIDIEAAVRDQCMDIGVFSSSTIFSHTQARSLIEDITAVLKTVSGVD